jgi:hypothetical protein
MTLDGKYRHMIRYGLSMAILDRLEQLRVGRIADQANRIGAPVKSNRIFVPDDIHVDGENLRWTFPREANETNWVRPTDRLLTAFVRLATGSDEDIARFARRYGVFGAAELIETAPRRETDLTVDGNRSWRLSADGSDVTFEPLRLWRTLSSEVGAILGIAAELNRQPPRPGLMSDWKTLEIAFDPSRNVVEDAQYLLQFLVNDWVKVGRVGLRLITKGWSKRRTEWETEIYFDGTYNLFGGLAIQLLLAVAGAEGLFTCSGCRLPYIRPGRTPKSGQNNYCDDCGRDRAQHDADRRRKDKMIEARLLASKGLNANQIASKINSGPKVVERWLKGVRRDGQTKTRKQ